MLTIKQISEQYPEHLQGFKRNMLREYLQYKILEALFEVPKASSLYFIGGTALRIVHGTARFSEALDFDTPNITADEFLIFSEGIKKSLELQGYSIEIKNVIKGAYHCYIRFPKMLFESGLSPYEEEKILIQIDAEAQGFDYEPEMTLINKFDIFTRIPVAPIEILLSQKICAALKRKRAKGRDFYDIVFLFAKTKPDFTHLSEKLGIKDMKGLKEALLSKCNTLDFQHLVKDVSPFLFFEKDRNKIQLFPEFVKSL